MVAGNGRWCTAGNSGGEGLGSSAPCPGSMGVLINEVGAGMQGVGGGGCELSRKLAVSGIVLGGGQNDKYELMEEVAFGVQVSRQPF